MIVALGAPGIMWRCDPSSTGCGLPNALEILADRYTLLRKIRPDDFTQSHEDYWTGFYS